MRVLIADDTVLMRAMLSEQVTSYGHDVILAKDGQEALDRAWSEPFDVAIIDWEMPRLCGLEVCWHLRADPRTAYKYLILMTAHDDAFYEFKALDAGADDFIHKPVNSAHLKARLKAGGRITEMQRTLLELAHTDGLTGVSNRRAFLERAGEEVSRARRVNRPLSVMMADIDHFKRINDSHGHPAGDAALKRFARMLLDGVPDGGLVGRYGGEEFVVLLPGVDERGAAGVAERLRAGAAALALDADGTPFRLTASFGVAALDPFAHHAVEKALRVADAALYRAKAGGRNRVETAAG